MAKLCLVKRPYSKVLTNVVYASLRSLMSLVTKLQKMLTTLDYVLNVIAFIWLLYQSTESRSTHTSRGEIDIGTGIETIIVEWVISPMWKKFTFGEVNRQLLSDRPSNYTVHCSLQTIAMKISVQWATKFQVVRKEFESYGFVKDRFISLTYSIKRSGPRNEPCGTLLRTIVADDMLFSMMTACQRYVICKNQKFDLTAMSWSDNACMWISYTAHFICVALSTGQYEWLARNTIIASRRQNRHWPLQGAIANVPFESAHSNSYFVSNT